MWLGLQILRAQILKRAFVVKIHYYQYIVVVDCGVIRDAATKQLYSICHRDYRVKYKYIKTH